MGIFSNRFARPRVRVLCEEHLTPRACTWDHEMGAALAAASDTEQSQQHRRDQDGLQDSAQQCHRVVRSKDRRSEELGKVQAEHTEEAQRATEQRSNSTDPTGPQSGGFVVAEDSTVWRRSDITGWSAHR